MAVLIKANNTTAYNLAGSWTATAIPTSNDTTKIDSTVTTAIVSGILQTANNTLAVTVGSIWIDSSFTGTHFRIGSSTATVPVTLNNTPDTANGAPNYSFYLAAGKNFQTINGLTIGASAANHRFFLGAGSSFSLNSYGTSPNSPFAGSGRISIYGGGELYQGLTSSTGTYSGGFDLFNGYLVVRGDGGTLPLGLATNTVNFMAEAGGSVGIKAGVFGSTRTIPNPVTFTSAGTIRVGDATATVFGLGLTGGFTGSGNLTFTGYGTGPSVTSAAYIGPATASTLYTGNVVVSGGTFWVSATSSTAYLAFNALPGVPRYDVDGPYAYLVFGGGPYDVTSEIYIPNTAANRGFLTVTNNINGANDGVWFKSSLTNIAWNTAPLTATATEPLGGFYLTSTSGTRANTTASVIDFPARVSLGGAANVATTTHLKYKGAGGVSYATNIDLFASGTPSTTQFVYLYADQQTNTAQGITISGNITKYGSTSSTFGQVLGLTGSNTADNTISGNIGTAANNRTQHILGVNKSGTGKWILAGDNTHAGNTTVDAGTLALANPNALRESPLDWRHGYTGLLTFEGGYSTYYVGTIASTVSGSRPLEIPAGVTLSVGGASWMTAALPDSGPVLTGAGSLTKNGLQTIYFSQVHALSGDLVVNKGALWSYPQGSPTNLRASMMFGSVSSITINNDAQIYDQPLPAAAISTTVPIITLNGTSTYTTGAWSASGGAEVSNTFTGTFSGTGTLLLAMYQQALAGSRTASIKTSSLPGNFSYSGNGSSAFIRRGIYRWVGTTNSVFPTNININVGEATGAFNTYLFSNDSPTLSTIEIQGTIDKNRLAAAGTASANLEVAGTGDIKFSGIIKETDVLTTATASLGIWKYGTNTLTLSGANTFRGDTRVQTGGLRLDHELALQNSALDWTNADTGSIDLTSAGLPAYTFGGLKSTTGGTRTLALPASLTLSVGNSLALTHTFAALLTGDATTTLKKIGTNQQSITSNNTGFLGATIVDGGSLTLWAGAAPVPTTRALPNMASLTVNGGDASEYLSVAGAVTHPITVNAGGVYSAASWLAADTGEFDLQQGVAGQGRLSIIASNLATNAVRYARTKTTTLPGAVTLATVAVASTSARYARLIYSGAAQSYPTNFRLVAYASPATFFGWSIYNVGTGKLTISGEVSKQNEATFSLTIAGTLTAGHADDTDDIELSGNIIQGPGETGALSITKAGPRTLTISGTASTYTGGLTHQTGTTILKHGTALGATAGAVATVLTAGTVQIDGGGSDLTFTKSSSAFTFGSASALTVQNVAGLNTITMASASLAGNVTFDVTTNTSLTLGGAISGVLANKLTKTSAGKIALTALTSGYLGPTEIRRGTLEVKKLNLAGQQSSIGAPAVGQATVELGVDGDAGILHTGTASDQTDRNLSFLGAAGTSLTINSSGTGSVNFTAGGTLAFSAGTHTLILSGTNLSTNTWARVIPDATGGAKTSLKKMGANLWNVTAAPTMTGTVEVAEGTLYFNGQARTLGGGLIMSGGTLTNDAEVLTFTDSMVLAGGTVEANLAGTGLAVEANAGLTIVTPTSGTNPGLTGTANINNGAVVKLVTETITTTSNGVVLGGLNVTVKAGGTLATPTGILQRGRARYSGNLTFEAGATLKIGGA